MALDGELRGCVSLHIIGQCLGFGRRVWPNPQDQPVPGLYSIGISHDCELYSLLVCCQGCAIACIPTRYSGGRDFSSTHAGVQQPVVSHSRNRQLSDTACRVDTVNRQSV
jgi:hypothetical protein